MSFAVSFINVSLGEINTPVWIAMQMKKDKRSLILILLWFYYTSYQTWERYSQRHDSIALIVSGALFSVATYALITTWSYLRQK